MPMNPGPGCEVWAGFPAPWSGRKDGTMSRRSPEHGASTEALLQKTFALNLRAARKSKRMTQAEVAKAIGVSTTVFWRYERARMWPSIETLRDMCKVLDVSASTLCAECSPEPGATGEAWWTPCSTSAGADLWFNLCSRQIPARASTCSSSTDGDRRSGGRAHPSKDADHVDALTKAVLPSSGLSIRPTCPLQLSGARAALERQSAHERLH